MGGTLKSRFIAWKRAVAGEIRRSQSSHFGCLEKWGRDNLRPFIGERKIRSQVLFSTQTIWFVCREKIFASDSRPLNRNTTLARRVMTPRCDNEDKVAPTEPCKIEYICQAGA
jgi:hypothetical protein